MTASKTSSSKEHHFVPKFYLRRFSKNGKQIHAFNFGRGRVIPNASIKGQCSRRNFHGFARGIEEELSKLEETTARVIRQVCEDVALPSKGSNDWRTLLTFLVFQKLRTGRSASVSRMLSDYYDSLVHGSTPPDEQTVADLAMMRQYPVAIPLSVAPDMVPVAAKLQMQLLLNKTRRPFLTSDDPVVTHNRFCEGIQNRGVNGWGKAGVQIVLPLDPRHCLMLYDDTIYGSREADRGDAVTQLHHESDIALINALQILNAAENVYFSADAGQAIAENECRGRAAERPTKRYVFVETEAVTLDEDREGALMHQFEMQLPLHFKLSFLKIRPQWASLPLGQRFSMRCGESPRPRRPVGESPVRYPVKCVVRK